MNAITVTPSGHARVQVADDRVTLDAADTALGQILDELARRGGFTLVCHDVLAERVTLRIDRLPFDEAFAVLLRDRNYTLHYVASNDVGAEGVRPTVRVATLYVYSARDSDSGTEQVDVGRETVERLGAEALTDMDASIRYQAVDALAEIGNERAIRILQQALTDPESDVREAAIDALGYIGGDESASALAIALNDESAMLREEAVAALGNVGGPVAITLLERAVDEGSRTAREILATPTESVR